MQRDAAIAKAAALKLEGMAAAWERSADFASRHTLLRSTILLVYDDADREHVELKMMNFGSCVLMLSFFRISNRNYFCMGVYAL